MRTPAPPARRSTAVAVFLSFVVPGLGQLYQRRRRAAVIYALPVLAVAAGGVLALQDQRLRDVALDLLDPSFSETVLILGILLGVWRLIAMVDPWLFARQGGRSVGAAARLGIVLGVLVVVGTHSVIGYYTWAFYDAGSQIFVNHNGGDIPLPGTGAGVVRESTANPLVPAAPAETPSTATSRITILLTGLDPSTSQAPTLTDTLLVLSVDPATKTAVIESIPRDLAQFPLWDGRRFDATINSLASYARDHPEAYPDGPTTTLVREVSYLVGVPVHYYAAVDLEGFVAVIDMVGGVTIDNDRAIDDPSYSGWRDGHLGFHLDAGQQHLEGEQALAFIRSRRGVGDDDFARARRQQQLLVALQAKLTDPDILPQMPALLSAVGKVVQTNFPAARVTEVLDLAGAVPADQISRVILGPPYATNPGGPGQDILVPDMDQLAKVSVRLFGDDSRYAGGRSGEPSPAP